MQRKKTFLVVCVSILTTVAAAQQNPFAPPKKAVSGLYPSVPALSLGQGFAATGARVIRPTAVVPAGFHPPLGYFCQKELQIQRITGLPLFFRLGSLDYVNQMEGKQAFIHSTR